MDILKIKERLKEYNDTDVSVYLNYLHNLSKQKKRTGELVAPWLLKAKDSTLVFLYKKVEKQGLLIDGEQVTLEHRAGVISENYNFQAYKNKLLISFPETIIDVGLVYDSDTFNFKKKSVIITYTHDISNPFDTNKKIIGAYIIIKNNRGEFLETIDLSDIDKMRNAAKTKFVWDAWFDRMVLKSVIKRGCKTHFNDVFKDIENHDNENYNLEMVNLDVDIQKDIDNINDVEQLRDFYRENVKNVSDEVAFLTKIKERKEAINGKVENTPHEAG